MPETISNVPFNEAFFKAMPTVEDHLAAQAKSPAEKQPVTQKSPEDPKVEVDVTLVTFHVHEEETPAKTKAQETATDLFVTDDFTGTEKAFKTGEDATFADKVRKFDASLRPGKKDKGSMKMRAARMGANFGVGAAAFMIDPVNDMLEDKILNPEQKWHNLWRVDEVLKRKDRLNDTDLMGMTGKEYLVMTQKQTVLDGIRAGTVTKDTAKKTMMDTLSKKETETAHEKSRKRQLGVAIQEFATDWAIDAGTDLAMSKAAGEKVEYASDISEMVSMPLQYVDKAKLYVNPVDIEAAWRVAMDIPVVGAPFEWAYDGGNTLLEKMDEHKLTRPIKNFVVGRSKDALKASIKGLTKERFAKARTTPYAEFIKTVEAIDEVAAEVATNETNTEA